MANKGGRPARQLGKKSKVLTVSITEDEMKQFEKLAEALEISKSELFRRMAKTFYNIGYD